MKKVGGYSIRVVHHSAILSIDSRQMNRNRFTRDQDCWQLSNRVYSLLDQMPCWIVRRSQTSTGLTFHQLTSSTRNTSTFHFKKHQTVPDTLHVHNSMRDQSKHCTGSIGSKGCIKRWPGLLSFFLLKSQRLYLVSFINDFDRFEVTCECIKKRKPLYGLH